MSGKELSKNVIRKNGQSATMFYVCQAKGCNSATVAAEREQSGRHPGGSFKYCAVHAKESRARMVQIFADAKAERDNRRNVHIGSVKGRTTKRGGKLVSPANVALRNDWNAAGLLDDNGQIRIKSDAVPALCAELATVNSHVRIVK